MTDRATMAGLRLGKVLGRLEVVVGGGKPHRAVFRD